MQQLYHSRTSCTRGLREETGVGGNMRTGIRSAWTEERAPDRNTASRLRNLKRGQPEAKRPDRLDDRQGGVDSRKHGGF